MSIFLRQASEKRAKEIMRPKRAPAICCFCFVIVIFVIIHTEKFNDTKISVHVPAHVFPIYFHRLNSALGTIIKTIFFADLFAQLI